MSKRNGNSGDHPAVEWVEVGRGWRQPFVRDPKTGLRMFLDGMIECPDWQDTIRVLRSEGWTLAGDIEDIVRRYGHRIEPPPEAWRAFLAEIANHTAPLTEAPFNNELARETWDRFVRNHPALAAHLNGTEVRNDLHTFEAFITKVHEAAQRDPLAILPEMLIGWIRHFPCGTYRDLPDLDNRVHAAWQAATRASVDAATKAAAQRSQQAQPMMVQKELSTRSLLRRDIPAPRRIAGDLVTSTARVFCVGPTGAGKTMFGLALAIGAASGQGFLRWRADRPFRVLYIDGEMPLELLQERVSEAVARVGTLAGEALDNLMIYSTDLAETIAMLAPDLGMLDPLNTDAGQAFVRKLCDFTKPELVIFDNVQALISGVQKEEETWTPVLALVQWLSSRSIGQVWIDHTARSTGQQYGTSTKSWRFDTVLNLLPVAADQQAEGDALALSIEFSKARRRKPANRQEFDPQTIRLTETGWTAETPAATPVHKPLSSRLRQYHRALLDAIVALPTGPGQTTRKAWLAECIRTGLVSAPPEEAETGDQRGRRESAFRKALHELREHGVIGVDGERVAGLSRPYR